LLFLKYISISSFPDLYRIVPPLFSFGGWHKNYSLQKIEPSWGNDEHNLV
jgi:hypothetical protein